MDGYVKKTDLYPPSDDPTSPADALRQSREKGHKSIALPVYASDGVTRVGTFVVGPAIGADEAPGVIGEAPGPDPFPGAVEVPPPADGQ